MVGCSNDCCEMMGRLSRIHASLCIACVKTVDWYITAALVSLSFGIAVGTFESEVATAPRNNRRVLEEKEEGGEGRRGG